MLRRDENSGKIINMKTRDAGFRYAFLVNARPESDFAPGTYGADLIIEDKETKTEIKEYLREVIEEGKNTIWKGKIPKDLHLPVKAVDPEKESGVDEEAMVIKTSTKMQPKLYIRRDSGKAVEVGEDEIDEIYSGMIGEAIIKFVTYDFKGNRGVKAYLSAVCKTGNGTPIGGNTNYEEVFSTETAFDEVMQDKSNAKKKKAKEEDDGEVNLDSLLSSNSDSESKSTYKGSKSRKVEVVDDEDEDTVETLDDLLKQK